MKVLKCIGYWILSCTWGGILTLIGAIVALALMIGGCKPHIFHYDVYFEVGKGWGGLELGPFFLVCKDGSRSIKQHEHGHGLQNIWWGPLYIFVIGLPSIIRYNYRNIVEKKKFKQWRTGKITYEEYREWYYNWPNYDDIWFEGQASALGAKYFT